jgi:flavin reductase (DIM6/NTAB) family NADH-FMN oxidoreductase RutF
VIDPALFRATMGRFATGVTIVTTIADGIDHAMTASSFVSLSLEPPLVLVCVERDSRFHEAIAMAAHWGVSILGEGQEECARWFATRGRPLEGQLDKVDHLRGESGVALIAGAIGHVQCRTVDIHPAGDHDIVIGEVVDLAASEGSPLVYFRARYRSLGQIDLP